MGDTERRLSVQLQNMRLKDREGQSTFRQLYVGLAGTSNPSLSPTDDVARARGLSFTAQGTHTNEIARGSGRPASARSNSPTGLWHESILADPLFKPAA